MNGDGSEAVYASHPPAVTKHLMIGTAAEATFARLARTQGDRQAAFRLRYEVYIAEQGKPYPDADHTKRILSDELDEAAEIIIAESTGQIVGTVRANWFDFAGTQIRYADMFQIIQESATPPERVAVCSRLAALPDQRHSRARELLFDAICEVGLARSTQLCFATCTPALVRMFKRYGFREYAAPITDRIAGPLCRLLLVLDDIEYLASVRSPFTAIAQRHSSHKQPSVGCQTDSAIEALSRTRRTNLKAEDD